MLMINRWISDTIWYQELGPISYSNKRYTRFKSTSSSNSDSDPCVLPRELSTPPLSPLSLWRRQVPPLSDFASLHLARLENGVGPPPRFSSFLYDFPSLLPSLCGLEYSVLGRVKWPPGPPSFPPSFGLYAGCPIRRAQKPRTRPSSFPIYGPGASAFL